MTEKRYNEANPRFRDEFGCVNDLLTGESYLCGNSGFIGERDADDTAIALCELLNKLFNENEELKQQIDELELVNAGLNYALKYIRKIDVEIDVCEEGVYD